MANFSVNNTYIFTKLHNVCGYNTWVWSVTACYSPERIGRQAGRSRNTSLSKRCLAEDALFLTFTTTWNAATIWISSTTMNSATATTSATTTTSA